MMATASFMSNSRGDDRCPLTEALNVNPIGHLEDLGHVVRDQDDRHAPLAEVVNELEHASRLPDPERCGRLVENDHLAAERCGPGHRHRLALTTGKRLDSLRDVLDRTDTEILQTLTRLGAHAFPIEHPKRRAENALACGSRVRGRGSRRCRVPGRRRVSGTRSRCLRGGPRGCCERERPGRRPPLFPYRGRARRKSI